MSLTHKILPLLLLPLSLWSFDFFPWFGTDFELEVKPYYAFRYFPNVNTDAPNYRDHEIGNLIGAEVSITALREWMLGVTTSLAQTSKMDFSLNQVGFIFGTQWANDRLGDPFALSSYLVINGSTSTATKDPILYHSARWEYELHTSIGKECFFNASWCSRSWLDAAIGFGSTGAPYFKGLLFFEQNFCDQQIAALFFRSWVGFGSRALEENFYGYGSIRHRNLDVGVRYAYDTWYWGDFGLDFSIGVIASNYPRMPIELVAFWRFNLGP